MTLPNLIDSRNALCIAPTGSGKTLSYLVPLINSLLRNP